MDKVELQLHELKQLIISTNKRVININELCAYTGLSRSTIYKLTMKGKIPYFKKAKHLYFDRLEIENWLKETRGFNVNDVSV